MRHSEEKLQRKETKTFLAEANSITGSKGYTQGLGRIGVDNRKNFLTQRIACHMKMLLRDTVEAPFLELENTAKAVADSI